MFPHQYTSVYPYAPGGRLPGGPGGALPDPLIWMAAMAAVTTKLRFMTGVIILPLRNPLVLAKQVATLDHMSGGRIELGIGVGWLKEEFEAVGVPFEKRGKRSDEYIAVMRKLWAEDGVSFTGEFVNVRRGQLQSQAGAPRGADRDRRPFGSGGQARRPAGRRLLPLDRHAGRHLPLFDVVRRTAEAAGRDPKSIEIMAGCPDLLPGSTKDPRAAIEERAKQGVGRIILPVWRYLPDLEDGLGRFGETVIRQFG